MDIAVWVAQAIIIAPLVVALTAMANQAIRPPTRYKPAIAFCIGILLGVALALSQSQRWLDGVWVGGIGGLIGAGLYKAGRSEEPFRG